VNLPFGYSELSRNPYQAQGRRAPRTPLQLEGKEVKSSINSSRASLKMREQSPACPETMEGPNKGQKPSDPNNTTGSAASWTPHGELLWGRNLDCKGIIAQGFLFMVSPWRQPAQAVSHRCTTRYVCLAYVMSETASGNLRSSLRDKEVPESKEGVEEGGVKKGHPWAHWSCPLQGDSGPSSESLRWCVCDSLNGG